MEDLKNEILEDVIIEVPEINKDEEDYQSIDNTIVEEVQKVHEYTLNTLLHNILNTVGPYEVTEIYIGPNEIRVIYNEVEYDIPREVKEDVSLAVKALSLYMFERNIEDPFVLKRKEEE